MSFTSVAKLDFPQKSVERCGSLRVPTVDSREIEKRLLMNSQPRSKKPMLEINEH